MKYIPGTAKLNIKQTKDKRYYNTFKIDIKYNLDDKNTLFVAKLSEFDILMLSYFKLNTFKVPNNWKAEIDCYDKSWAIGGSYIEDNNRFDICENDKNWLYVYAISSGLFIEEEHRTSIDSIKITWYDDKSLSHECELPNVCSKFSSEKEFIGYIRRLYDKINS